MRPRPITATLEVPYSFGRNAHRNAMRLIRHTNLFKQPPQSTNERASTARCSGHGKMTPLGSTTDLPCHGFRGY